MPRILSYGSLNLDIVYQVPHFVRPGETLASCGREIVCGGKGLNQSVAAAHAGGTVFHAGKIGQDGGVLLDTLRSSGVDTSLVSVEDGPSGHTVIQVAPDGQNCILLYGGSNQRITPEEVDRALEPFGAGDYLMLQNEVNCLRYIMERATDKGIFLVFNPSPISDVLGQLPMQRVGLLIFNEIEGAALAGDTDAAGILNALRARWPQCRLLLTLGSEGCIYDDGSQRIRKSACRTQVVDTTAAGDTFTGYFVACMAAGMPVESCLDIASRAAAIAVSHPGAAPSIPTMNEVQAR